MGKAEKLISKIATLLGINVELEQVKLIDGQTVIEAETFEAGKDVFVVTEEGNVPVPSGNYELETGQILVVEQDGVIKEILEAEAVAEAEEAEENPNPEEAVEAKDKEKMSDKPVRRTIESIVKETVFSRVEELSKENETLKAELSTIKKELEEEKAVKLSATEKRIKHNPEPKAVETGMKYAEKAPKSGVNAILNKIYNK